MSVKVMGLVWDLDIPSHEKFVLMAYADHAAHDGTGIYPAVGLIAKKVNASERAVQYATRKLQKLGLLVLDGKGPRGTNKWRIPLDGGAIPAPVQIDADGGASRRGKGVQTIAPEPSEPSITEPSIKDRPTAAQIPELVLIRSVMHRFPVKALHDEVVKSVQRVRLRVGRDLTAEDLAGFYRAWCRKGYNPMALSWLEWAESGRIPQNGNFKPSGALAAGEAWLAQHQENP